MGVIDAALHKFTWFVSGAALMTPDLAQINEHLDVVILVAESPGRYSVIGRVPAWLYAFEPALGDSSVFNLETSFAFFSTFIDEIHDVLRANNAARVSSGPWSEVDLSGTERNLSATALMIEGQVVIELKMVDAGQLYHQAIFQKAREYSLAYEHLQKEQDRKQVLLHAIVHDLTGPLTAITGAIDMLSSGGSFSETTALLKLAREQCAAERDLIQSILETFLAESYRFDPERTGAAPEVLRCVGEVVNTFVPAYESEGLKIATAFGDDLAGVKVVAEADRLRRVVSNLLENAMRYSPPASTTTVAVRLADGGVQVSVTDEGDGNTSEIRRRLAENFSASHDGNNRYDGKTGFGLYLCRITVGRWGGTIGCDDLIADRSAAGGKRIWFNLKVRT